MKRILTTITALILALVVLAGCTSKTSDAVTAMPSATEAPAPILLTRGTIEGRVYTNKSAELTFTAPEGWKYFTDEEIAEFTGSGVVIEQSTYDMIAAETATRTNIMIMYDNLAMYGIFYEEDAYLEQLREDLKDDPYDMEFGDYSDFSIGLNTYRVMPVYYKDYGMTQYYYVRRIGDYMLCILTSINPGSDVDSVMANFS